MNDVLEKLSSLEKRQQVVDVLLEEAIKLMHSQIGYFAIMNAAEDELTMLGWSKSAMSACATIDKPIIYPIVETGLWGDCVRERKAVITNDYENCTRVTKRGYPDGHVQVIRHLNVPMWGNGKITGILGVGNKETDYTEADGQALQALADAAWPYLHRAV